jgi:hypothetical protein
MKIFVNPAPAPYTITATVTSDTQDPDDTNDTDQLTVQPSTTRPTVTVLEPSLLTVTP